MVVLTGWPEPENGAANSVDARRRPIAWHARAAVVASSRQSRERERQRETESEGGGSSPLQRGYGAAERRDGSRSGA